jgi:hypothetical protein
MVAQEQEGQVDHADQTHILSGGHASSLDFGKLGEASEPGLVQPATGAELAHLVTVTATMTRRTWELYLLLLLGLGLMSQEALPPPCER